MAYDAAAQIQESARNIKELIEKTKSNMLLGNEFVAQGRNKREEQTKF